MPAAVEKVREAVSRARELCDDVELSAEEPAALGKGREAGGARARERVDHQILGIHHVNETVPQSQWIYWDIGFLLWGALMIGGGWLLMRSGRQETVAEIKQRKK